VAAVLLGAGGARANQGDATRETQRLRTSADALASKSRGVVLELYGLQSELARSEVRLARLQARSDEVAREQESAEHALAAVKLTLAAAQTRLEQRLLDLYVQGEPDPLAVVLGAESIDEALSTLDSMKRIASQDVAVVRQVRQARVDVREAVHELDRRSTALRALVAQAASATASLRATQQERRAYLASLIRQRHLAQSRVASLASQASAAQETASGLGGGAQTVSNGPSVVVDTSPGTQMTVSSTGYAIQGTTATGVPTGWGVVAVDPSVIPLGTRMTIPGYGDGVAADTGGAVVGHTIDLWFPTVAQALAWGRRTVTITLH
jgi:3D (Asp-Asp-Asp) domain-containing protein/peptidoglycan hydrolase CwlO-like protein